MGQDNLEVISKELSQDTEKYDIIVVGGGFSSAITVYNLLQLDKNLNILVIEKRRIGSHDPSYYMPMDLVKKLNVTHLIKNIINSLSYETDAIDYSSVAYAKNGFANVDYTQLCKFLMQGVEIRIDGFQHFVDRSNNILELESNKLVTADIIIDATGWESVIRQQLGMPVPIIGAKTVLWELENCDISNQDQMILGVGDFASLGFWLEPQDNNRLLVGSGFWDDLTSDTTEEEKIKMDTFLLLYLKKYNYMVTEAKLVRKSYAKISVDPVKQIVNKNIICIGESAGMSNPYWLLGSGLIYDHSEVITDIIVKSLRNEADLDEIQHYWEKQLRKYGKLWASSRVLWNGNVKNWKEIFENREKLQKYTTKEQVVDRQRGGSYSISYASKLLGWKRLLKVGYYYVIFKIRSSDVMVISNIVNKFWKPTYRKHSLVDIDDNSIKTDLDTIYNRLIIGTPYQSIVY